MYHRVSPHNLLLLFEIIIKKISGLHILLDRTGNQTPFFPFLEKLIERVVIQESCNNPNIQGLSSDSGAIKPAIPACIGIA